LGAEALRSLRVSRRTWAASIRLAAATGLRVSMAAATLRRASTAGRILAVGTRAEAVIRVATLAVNITIDAAAVSVVLSACG